MLQPRIKSPKSFLGAGRSTASSDDEVLSSDVESDSGIDMSHTEIPNPEAGMDPLKKGLGGPCTDNEVPHGGHVNAATTSTLSQSNSTEQWSENRIDSYIQCLDEKVNKKDLTKEALQLLRLIPEGYIPLPHQVGGHRHVEGKLGFLRHVGQREILFKPVPPQDCPTDCPREVLFYKNVFGPRFVDLPKEVIALQEFIPKYYGTQELVDRAGEIHQFIKLEDIVSQFNKPCILDIKVGRRVWDDFASQSQIDHRKKKYPQHETIGFSIMAMRVYQSSTDEYTYYDKRYGRSVQVSGMLNALNQFFMDGQNKRTDVIGPIVERLYYFLHLMEQQKLYRFFATSLIIVYEGDSNRPIRKPKDHLDIRLVDFTHTYERDPSDSCEPDYNTLFGLRNLIKYMEQLNVSISSSTVREQTRAELAVAL